MSGQGSSERPQQARAGRPQDQDKVGTLTRLADGREFSLGFGSLRVGRQKRADVVVDDRTVSRHHADICYESGRYVVYDHSANGTWINDQPVAVARALRDSDTIRFGEAEFRFSLKALAKAPDAKAMSFAGADSVAKGATHVVRAAKRRRRRRAALLIVFAVLLLLLIVAGVAIYFLFPGLAQRMMELAPSS